MGLCGQLGGLCEPCLRRRGVGRRCPRIRAVGGQGAQGAVSAALFLRAFGEVNPQLLARLPERQPSSPRQQIDGVAAFLAVPGTGPRPGDAVLHGERPAGLFGEDAEAIRPAALRAGGMVLAAGACAGLLDLDPVHIAAQDIEYDVAHRFNPPTLP